LWIYSFLAVKKTEEFYFESSSNQAVDNSSPLGELFAELHLPLRHIVILAAPSEILVGKAVDKLEMISTKRLNSTEQVAIWQPTNKKCCNSSHNRSQIFSMPWSFYDNLVAGVVL